MDCRNGGDGTPIGGMEVLFSLMSTQHAVASSTQARAAGVSASVERRLVRDGTLVRPHPGVLALSGGDPSFESRCMAAALAPGTLAVSHGAAARLHGLDGFDRHESVEVIGARQYRPSVASAIVVHRTRGPVREHVIAVSSIPTMCVASTLALLAPWVGIRRTARALDSALRLGVSPDVLKAVATTWRRRGRSGPPALLMLLGERVDKTLPRSWFQRLAKQVLASLAVALVDEYAIRDRHGRLLAELDLAHPPTKVGVECQSWRWHATPTAQQRDARRRGMLRQLGWEIVDVWWSDLKLPDRVLAELRYLLRTRSAPVLS